MKSEEYKSKEEQTACKISRGHNGEIDMQMVRDREGKKGTDGLMDRMINKQTDKQAHRDLYM